MSRKRVCESPPKAPTATRSRQPPREVFNEQTYIPGLSERQRVDMILKHMHEQHRWTLKSFIYHLVMAQPEEKNARSAAYRTQKLSEAIYEQKEVVTELHKIPETETTESVRTSQLVAHIRSELSQFGNPAIGLAQFDTEESVDQLDIPGIASRVQVAAPRLWALLVSIMAQQHPSARDTSKDFQGSVFMICVILASAFAPRTCNKFPVLLGLHLHSMGVKRRTINLLYGLGVIANYMTIMRRRDELVKLGKVAQ
ncbi:hypothetical protein N7532_009753 [Penicillium argentinense]|uniref:Uncharacterized protein n=2 Tax=Penicillium argentinense TaxID=1131581 RepID=A0A9W9ENC4_9EURO|nr:uncharacterized protein N7532_009753 [Penicillium argentinense]KAJ5084982.1 hypothetical protein N7532_009753 [Penicillium argentinense]